MYKQLYLNGIGDFINTSGDYWSSSEANSWYSFKFSFTKTGYGDAEFNGGFANANGNAKDSWYWVRAVRSF